MAKAEPTKIQQASILLWATVATIALAAVISLSPTATRPQPLLVQEDKRFRTHQPRGLIVSRYFRKAVTRTRAS